MAIKPTLYPDWAVKVDGTDNDVVDGTTGENNVVAPSAPKQLLGWEYNEKPPYQYFNWLSRLTTQWIRWFEATRQVVSSGDFEVKVVNTYLTVEKKVNVHYTVLGDQTFLDIPELTGIATAGAPGTEMKIAPSLVLSWPDYLLPRTAAGDRWFPVTVVTNGYNPVAGVLQFAASGSSNPWILQVTNPATGQHNPTGFTAGAEKGILSIGITFQNSVVL